MSDCYSRVGHGNIWATGPTIQQTDTQLEGQPEGQLGFSVAHLLTWAVSPPRRNPACHLQAPRPATSPPSLQNQPRTHLSLPADEQRGAPRQGDSSPGRKPCRWWRPGISSILLSIETYHHRTSCLPKLGLCKIICMFTLSSFKLACFAAKVLDSCDRLRWRLSFTF